MQRICTRRSRSLCLGLRLARLLIRVALAGRTIGIPKGMMTRGAGCDDCADGPGAA
jgi:hypothetical protein